MIELKAVKINNKRRIFKLFNKYSLGVLLTILIMAVGLFFTSQSQPEVFKYIFGQSNQLQTEDGRVNVLLLGIAGGNHDGPNLTDTIMVASYDRKTHQVDLISLPRDLWSEQYQAKINTLYQVGLNQAKGLSLIEGEIERILGIQIPYAVRIDFSGFTRAIDLIGGIDVEVAKPFDDYAYPVPGKETELCGYQESEMDIGEDQAKSLGVKPGRLKVLLDPDNKIATAAAKPGENLTYGDAQVIKFFPCRFEHLSFSQGLIHFGGETALKYVRSRHGANNEGSDFARSHRQQQVIQAFRDKALSVETLTDPRKIVELVKAFGASFDSDIPQGQYWEFVKLVKNVSGVKSYVIDSIGKDPLLVAPPPGQYGAWVLVPSGGDYSRIQKYVQDIFSGTLAASGSAKIN